VNFGDKALTAYEIMRDGTKRAGPKNRRAEMWLKSRDWLQQTGGAQIPDLDSLQTDATTPGFHYDVTTQQLIIESKEKIASRGGKSTDEWDAVALTFAEPVRDTATRDQGTVRVATRSGGELSWMGN